MSMEVKGLNEFLSKLEKISRKAEDLEVGNKVTFNQLFSEEFMSQYTNFTSIQELFDFSSFNVHTKEDFQDIPDEQWEAYIVQVTQFENWKDMQEKAWKEYFIKQLNSIVR